ncbi:MAG TPA: tRNA (guanosine(37)-N1)-methyltransferase TrmD [Candidatus Saccharimonadales bacterium]|jgi:tRNA (guanine37-N1)-methyltransferase|nr:tRNA (guanosine(37)-N1)-methyltransferase TrmD [Candidatus Saccharimonadales bacterium]
MKIIVISLFPEMFDHVLNISMLKKAQDKGIISLEYLNLRDYGLGRRRQVDDVPYGGGDGMLLKPEPLFAAIEAAKAKLPSAKVFLMTPRGGRLAQAKAADIAQTNTDMIIVCAHYEGYDERVTKLVDEQLSIGDYIVTGGEIPAMVLIDCVVRLLPGVLGGEQSAVIESFADGQTLEFPQYTRPPLFRKLRVPKVLLNGNHAEINAWRQSHSKKAKK